MFRASSLPSDVPLRLQINPLLRKCHRKLPLPRGGYHLDTARHTQNLRTVEVKISATKELAFGHKKKGIVSKKLGQMEKIYSEIHHCLGHQIING